MTFAASLRRCAAIAVLLCAAAWPAAQAEPPSATDRALIIDALRAAEQRDYASVADKAGRAESPIARTLIRWRYLIEEDSGASFADLAGFLQVHPNWPSDSSIQRNAERAMPSDLPASDVLAFFAERKPLTGEGRLFYGMALLAQGNRAEGETWIRKGYITGAFSPEREATLRAQLAAYLPPDADAQRLTSLIWAERYSDATRMMRYVDAPHRALGEARLKLRANTKGADRFVRAVPDSLSGDSGLNFDLGRWYRRNDAPEAGARYMARAQRDADMPMPLDKWWDERAQHVRLAIRDRRFRDAYQLAATSGLTEGADFAEAEFLAGWVQLRFLKDPATAEAHFARIPQGATAPISLARGWYWTGRAREAQGNRDGAREAYAEGAKFPEAYYGQIAAARIDAAPQAVLDMTTSVQRGTIPDVVRKDELVQALEMLISAGDERMMTRFATALGDKLQQREDYEAAAALLMVLGEPSLSVKVAKRAMQKQLKTFRAAYPMIQLPAYQGTDPEPSAALVHAFIRQETEFDPNSRSGADARGLMQMIPATARATARKHGIPWVESRLLSDPEYNATLGMAHLGDLLGDYGGSIVLTAVAYNAGPGRVSQWTNSAGDPRSPTVDVLDWIELIPFSETRNYVMRILDATNVYRAMLAGGTGPIQIEQDLVRGSGRSSYSPPGSILAAN